MNRSGMSQNEFYKADVDTESHRSGTLGGPVATKANEPFAIKGCEVALPQMSLEHIEGCGLGAARGLARIAHVVDMKVDEFAECFQARRSAASSKGAEARNRRCIVGQGRGACLALNNAVAGQLATFAFYRPFARICRITSLPLQIPQN
ncbi:hypothetical protein [Mesorhizobium sp.]|uniref:hypothetical protein n=1 Tax=Mesorhizobium sp. TaxID=1871066 RepID=UPI0025ED3CA9|nr:hypothetical protein [Mesorhizobium sp.]